MNTRPMLQESQGAPSAAAAKKRKPSAAPSKIQKNQKPENPSADQENQPKNRWVEKLQELIAEVSLSTKRAEEFSDCDELLACKLFCLR